MQYMNLGTRLASVGRIAEAEEAYRAALKLKPDDPVALSNLGKLLESQGRSSPKKIKNPSGNPAFLVALRYRGSIQPPARVKAALGLRAGGDDRFIISRTFCQGDLALVQPEELHHVSSQEQVPVAGRGIGTSRNAQRPGVAH
jgi:tetratricopeptide (TPR) repeat protein